MKAFSLLCLLALSACGTLDVTPYTGRQQDWPTAPGAFAKTVNGIPIYRGLPDRPYEVIGHITARDVSHGRLAGRARELHADAVLIMDEHVIGAGSLYLPGQTTTYHSGALYGKSYYGTSSSYTAPGISIPLQSTITTAYLIRFTPPPQP